MINQKPCLSCAACPNTKMLLMDNIKSLQNFTILPHPGDEFHVVTIERVVTENCYIQVLWPHEDCNNVSVHRWSVHLLNSTSVQLDTNGIFRGRYGHSGVFVSILEFKENP